MAKSGLPVPDISSLIIADLVVLDKNTGKRSILCTFNRVKVSRGFPHSHASLSVYWSLSNCRGVHDMTFSITPPATTDNPAPPQIFNTGGKIDLGNDPLQIHEMDVKIENLVFPVPGAYMF